MAGRVLLAEGFVKTHSASYGNVQGLDDAHLWNDKIAIREGPYLFADPRMFIAEDQSDALGKVEIIQACRFAIQMGSIYSIVPAPQLVKTGRGIRKLVDREPAGRAAAAPGAPFLVPGDTGIQHVYFLYTHRVTGTHDSRDIVGIENVLEDHGYTVLPFVQHL
jgi:hypothetical protein